MSRSRRRMGMSTYMKLKNQARAENKKMTRISLEHITRIEKHRETSLVEYPEYKEAFDYVDKLFPEAEIKKVVVLKTSGAYLARLGYKGIGGFFNKIAQKVVIPEKASDTVSKAHQKECWSGVRIKATFDEILVHELLHYASSKQPRAITSTEMEEEFAYGHSVNYLRLKGHSDKEIVKDNFMPYLVSTLSMSEIASEVLIGLGHCMDDLKEMTQEKQKRLLKKHEKKILALAKERSLAQGLELIRIFTETPDSSDDQVKIDDGSKKFNMMDW